MAGTATDQAAQAAGECSIAGENVANNIFSTYSLDRLKKRTSEKWRAFDPDVLPLWVAEMDVPLEPSVKEELVRLVDEGDTGYDSSVDGRRYLQAYADFAKRRWNANIDIEHGRTTVDVISGIRAVIVSTLGHRAIVPGAEVDRANVHRAALAATGVETPEPKCEGTVIVQTPIYPPFLHRLPKNYTLAVSPLNPETHHTDFENLEETFSAATAEEWIKPSQSGYNAVFVLCSPHNPSGTVFEAEELTRIISLCDKYHVRLVVDEIHSPIVVDDAPFVPILALPEASKAIVAVSASKGYSLPGFKAAMLVPGKDPEAQKTIDDLSQDYIHTGAHVASNVHASAFENGDAWLDRMVEGLAQNERIFRTLMAEKLPKATVVLGKGTYLAFVDFGGYVNGTQWEGKPAEGLLEKGRVGFNPGDTFGGTAWANYVRVNLATNPRIIAEAVTRMAEFVKGL
ncbi:MAG: aminotransferase class I/II-fold pyridoxal phosphate-dependent enzyme [Bifidobacteriaceae bacterium]|nr:aminotransferase class I/II-fold pyridoxal phosphate-dependent enzyme [Bifidobacteriaceae bacterium]